MEDTELMDQRKNVEKDRGSVNYVFIILFYFLGTVCYTPQNFYVTANEYWMYKFRNLSLSYNDTGTKTALQTKFTSYTSSSMYGGTVVFLVITIIIRKRVVLQKRIIGSMVAMFGLLVLTLVFTFVDTDPWQDRFFTVAIIIGGLLSSSSSVLLMSLFQLAFQLHPRCLAAQLAGQSVCGILASAVQVIALLVVPSVEGTAAFYYTVAAVTVAGTIVAYLLIVKRSEELQTKLTEEPTPVEDEANPGPKIGLATVKDVARKMALVLISLFLGVANTSLLHSGLTSLMESSGKGSNTWSDTYFVPVCVFLSFHVFDFIGREGSNYISKLRNTYIILATSLTRLVLIPLILLCNLQSRDHLPVVFKNDAFFIIFLILLGVSNGYILNISVVMVPKYCVGKEKIIGAGYIVVIIILVGLIFSVLSGVIVNAI